VTCITKDEGMQLNYAPQTHGTFTNVFETDRIYLES